MVKMKDLIKGYDFNALDTTIQLNLSDLLLKVQKLERLYKKPLLITSGLRTKEDQLRVYKQKGITDINKIPMGSRHITGQACDISDPDFELTAFCKANDFDILKVCKLYAEDDMSVKRLHVQTISPMSGNRLFKP